MKKYHQEIELIIKQAPAAPQSKQVTPALTTRLKNAGIDTEFVTTGRAPQKKSMGNTTAPAGNLVVKTKAKDTEINPWDMAHLSADALGKSATYIEPNFINEYVVDRKIDVPSKKLSAKSFGSGKTSDDFDPDWEPHDNLIWHLGNGFSQLEAARNSVMAMDYPVRIGHLDTGYSKKHFIIPASVKQNTLQRNFIAGENAGDAYDPLNKGFLKQPGHGTGTFGILAGGIVNITTGSGPFKDYLGGAPFAEVICCRVAESVILLKTNAFAEALNYLTALSLSGTQIHVVSMSMGGAPSKLWADAVNAAYEAGITVVTAAGNNFAGLPTRHVIYPARFGRVIAACGVTNDFKPYETKKLDEMQGCFGPKKHMSKALAAFTPNTPWASVESGSIRFSGAGTSSATPQVAAAAAIYYRKYNQELDALKPWQRVEAIRNALYHSALKKVKDARYNKDFTGYFGNGIIQAKDALDIPPAKNLPKTAEDTVPWFPILSTIFKARPGQLQSAKRDMFNTELAQLVYSHPELNSIIDNDTRDYDKIGQRKWKQFRDAVINHPETSLTLKKYLEETSSLV